MTRPTRRSPTFAAIAAQAKLTASPKDPWSIAYFRRHKDDDPAESTPGREYMNECPTEVRSHFRNVLIAVATAPPPKFAGGGYWEAMHGDMTGCYEVRKKRNGLHYRLFCLLDEDEAGVHRLVVLAGMTKPDGTVFSDSDYAEVRELGDEYKARSPRSVV